MDKAKAGRQNAKRRAPASVDDLLLGIKKGDTAALAKAITLMESTNEGDREMAYALMEQCLPLEKETIRIGITGVPGVGKSTFIEALGALLTAKKKKVAVLAIDPSSSLSKGSIMGDKTRMQDLSRNPLAFVRPSPSGENLGGVARNTREAMLLCEAAGYEVILVETVGVGQGETAVHSMVDFFLLLQLPGAGDELQGIKRGIVEMADAIVVNKADGPMAGIAEEARASCERALQLYPPKENGWVPRVLKCSSLQGKGISEVWDLMEGYHSKYSKNGALGEKREQQNVHWFHQTIESLLSRSFYASKAVKKEKELLLEKVRRNTISPFRAGALLLQVYQQELK